MAILIIVLFLVIRWLLRINADLKDRLLASDSSKKSLSTRYGKLSEQFMPFLKDYPYDEHNFRFIGSPIDGIQFEEDAIILTEFKTASSKLSPGQKHIKNLIDAKKVYFEEFRIEEENGK